MYQNYKVVVNTAAGRRRYMQYLIPYIVACPIVDRYDIWVNTHNGADIEFFRQVAAKFPVVNLVWQPDGVVNGNATINAFYKACVEPHTIYFKLDDDVVWMEPRLIEKMVKFRVENPDCFLVSPLVINNALSTYLLQVAGKIKLDGYYNADASHPVLWKNGAFALELHQWFINHYLRTDNWEKLHLGRKLMGMTRFSINAILWFGDEMAKFGGVVPDDDEEYLSCIYPTQRGMANAWNGDAIVAHFAFFTQRERLDKAHILETYGSICHEQWSNDETLAPIESTVRAIMDDISRREEELMAGESPYRRVTRKVTWRGRVRKCIPQVLLQLRELRKQEKHLSGFIVFDRG